ncbi:MAG: hypothetical protein EA385_06830 [Salinarimonadaceae bacterium]|nr:MAG: hypothetical protein EA385_06830 [Salinarimonadaceae bacterium]
MRGLFRWAVFGRLAVLGLSVALGLAIVGTQVAHAQERHALVIGVDRYENVPDLLKAGNDARAVAEVLEVVGFRVTLGVDIQRRDYSRLMSEFTRAIAPGDEAIFYFAGHGIEVDGRNYLLPADVPAARPGDEDFVRSESIAVDHVLDMIGRAGARVSMVILDACRDNPFPREGTRSLGGGRGLGRVAPAEGTFVLYSAGINQLALDRLSDDDPDPNSVFTRALLPLLVEPGLPVQGMVRRVRQQVREMAQSVGHIQFPAYYDQLTDDYLIVPASLPGVGDAVPGVDRPVAVDHCTSARADWVVLRDTDSVSALQNYAEAHAQCPIFANLARERLADISVGSCLAMAGDEEDLRGLASGDLMAVIDTCRAAHETNKDDAEIAYRLGLALQVDRRAEPSHGMMTLAAERGHPGAMLAVARFHQNRFRDRELTAEWFWRAADTGNPEALVALAENYAAGRFGFRSNETRALELFEKAIAAGPDPKLLQSQAIGDMARRAGFREQRLENFAEAARYFRLGAEAGNASAMNQIGWFYRNGLGVAQDDAEAMRWFRRGAEAGNATAMGNIGSMYDNGLGVAQDYAEAMRWFRRAAEAGNAFAMNQIGWFYENGLGVAQDYAEAMRWYHRAAEAGSAIAMNNVGFLYAAGRGVARNEREAARWFMRALRGNAGRLSWTLENFPNANRGIMREVQRILQEEGVYSGPLSGAFGPQTRAALEAYANLD